MSSFLLNLQAELRGQEFQVWSVSWRPCSDELACCGGQRILLWKPDAEEGWRLKSAIFNEEPDLDQTEPHHPPVLGSTNASPSSSTANVVRVTANQIPIANPNTHDRTVRNMAWTSDGAILAAVSFDATTSVWNESDSSWQCLTKIEGHENEVKAASWSPTHSHLATCSRDKTIWIHSWNGPSKDEELEFLCSAVLSGHTQDVKSVVWHPTQDLVVSASYDNSLRLWAPSPTPNDEAEWHCAAVLNGHQSTVWSISFAPSGLEFASGSDDGTIRIWSPSLPPSQESTSSPSLSPNPSKLGLHPWLYINPAFRAVVAKQTEPSIPLSTLEWTCSAVIAGHHPRTIYCVAWHPQLDVIATACGDDSIRVFQRQESAGMDIPQWDLICHIPNAHACDVNAVAWKLSPEADGSWLLASGGDDGVVRIFKLEQKDA